MGATTGVDLDGRLYRQLQLVNDWLKFAEAKNMGMVGFASGALAVLLGFLTAIDLAIPVGATIFIAGGGLGLLVALLLSLVSFLPRTNLERVAAGRTSRDRTEDNLYYYGHVASYEPRVFVEAMIHRHLRGDLAQMDDGHLDLAGQIITNARITLGKLRLFTFSIVCFAVGNTLSPCG
jgi:hypothetical protein